MKASDLRTRADSELRDECTKKREEITRLVFQEAVERVQDPSALRRARKDVARILTVLRERELASARESGGAASQGEKKV